MWVVLRPGDIAPRLDALGQVVVVLSSPAHLEMIGRVICCPYVTARLADQDDDQAHGMIVVSAAGGTLLPEFVQWLPAGSLGVPVGTTGVQVLGRARLIVAALIGLTGCTVDPHQ